jgi:dolichyl-diphosphooligosaccharide--protein glycosyltransferase
MHAINIYGYIIHEFDPWFHYRATEYLSEHGMSKFFKWYDYMSWYPLGRPVGTTIYPGMQIAAVGIWETMKKIPTQKVPYPAVLLAQLPKWAIKKLPNAGKALSFGPMSLNDVCCMVPPWFGSLATFFIFLLTVECSESNSAGVFAAFIMAIIPAHIMRSVGGGYDNEAVAVSAFTLVLWLWCRSLRTPRSWLWGVPAGLAYTAAASSWGGYIFVNNMVALHAAVLVGLGRYNSSVYRAFSLYWIIGTVGACQVPVIGWTPLRSLEQMPSLLVFLGFQVMEACDMFRRRQDKPMTGPRYFMFRVVVFALIGALLAVAGFVLMQMGIFMPLGARIRGLFLEAVKTGNPLVDSVAEHSPSSTQAFDMYLGKARFLALIGMLFCWHQRTPAKFLPPLYAVVAYHYSVKMSRLMIINGPIVSMLAGFPLGIVADWCLGQLLNLVSRRPPAIEEPPVGPLRTGGMCSIWRGIWRVCGPMIFPAELRDLLAAKEGFAVRLWPLDRGLRAVMAVAVLSVGYTTSKGDVNAFIKHCNTMAKHMSGPQIAFETTLSNGEPVIVDDYIRGYEWVKKNTPADSRVMAWWDYGYQITGIANRTSIADGNTWNHEHIATLGRILTSPEKRCHKSMRHLADYALVWAGGHGDDMGKSPHLARIGNSVFPDHCGDDDPLCQKFLIYSDGSPTPMMAQSFLYKAVNHNKKAGVKLNPKYFQEVHTTKYGLMRVFKVLNVSHESKDWIANPANRVCDAPGSWYCVGQYPPAIQPLIAKRRNFAQLEDFNKKGAEKSAYTKLIEKERSGGKSEDL